MSVSIRAALEDREAIASRCLHALPAWFGRPEATARYIAAAAALPMLAAYDAAKAIGFLTLRDLDPSTAEIHVIGILPAYHRRGIGHRLVAMAADDCRRRGIRHLEVLTLGEAHPDPNYAKTRAFYRAIGFVPLRRSELEDGTPMMTMTLALDSTDSQLA